MSSDSEVEINTPPDILEAAKNATSNILPVKSRERYETIYKKFMEWRVKNKIGSFSENVLLVYFEELSKEMKPTSLWAIYSMLRTTINIYHNINIANYMKLNALLKRKSDGYKCKKSKVLTRQHVQEFLEKAPDSKYLLMKVVLITGLSGACRKQELRNIKMQDIEDTGNSLIITIPDTKTKTQRTFVVSRPFYDICKKYIKLRPKEAKSLPFFINYLNEKCTKQPVGLHKIGNIPRQIATYLKLPDEKLYSGHCFRRSSATILVEAGGDLLELKKHGGWRSSTIAESYVDTSLQGKIETSEKITSAIKNNNISASAICSHDNINLNCNKSTELTERSMIFNNCSVTINNNYYYKEI